VVVVIDLVKVTVAQAWSNVVAVEGSVADAMRERIALTIKRCLADKRAWRVDGKSCSRQDEKGRLFIK